MMLQHHEIQDRLSAFLDGELSEGERVALEGHLARCDECLEELSALAALVDQARTLPREIPPARDLWPEIEARIRADSASRPQVAEVKVVTVDFASRNRRALPVWVLRLAAAITLVVMSSGVTAWVLRSPGPAPQALTGGEPAAEASAGAGASFASTAAAYEGATEALERELEARRHLLSPETIATVEENLRIIDEAIAEARAALGADPNNHELPLILSGVYRQKVQLLRTAVELSQSS